MRRIIGVISVFSVMEAFGILLSLGLGVRAAGDNSTNGSCFTLSEGKITDYNVDDTQCGKNVTIPSVINGVNITEIGEKAFYDKGLTSVSIPNSIVKIGSSAFAGNDIKNLVLPNSVTTVSYAAFQGNKNLEKIRLSESMEYIPANFCDGCNIKELEDGIPKSIKKIYTTAFYARGSQENEGGYTVWTNPTFRNMDKIVIPEYVTNIYGGGLGATWSNTYEILSKDIDIDRVTSYNRYGSDGVIFKLTKGAKVKYSITNVPGHSTSMRDHTYVSIRNLEDDGVAVNFIISGDYTVFQPVAVGLKQGTKVSYPTDIELTGYTIEGWYKDEGFNEKFDINSEPINENITLYGKLNQKPCWEFTVTDNDKQEVEVKKFNIDYPHCAAWYNENYETFTVPTKVPSGLAYEGYDVIGIGDMAFCDKVYQNGMGEVERSFVGKITIPYGIRYIGAKNFKSSSLESIILPDSITSIGEQAFFSNHSLKNIKWSENLQSIGSNAFAFSSLKSIKFPDSLKSIGYAAFHESLVDKIEFGSGSQLQTIGYLAFGYSDPYNGPQYGSIKNVIFPKTLKSIENRAFYNNKVEEVTLLCDNCTVYANAFEIEGRADRQLPGYKRGNAKITNYDMHLVLKDIIETHSITLDSDGATEKGTEKFRFDLGTPIYYLDEGKTKTMDEGITIPTKKGYTFKGYFTEKDGKGSKYISPLGVIGKIYNLTEDTTLYASWKKDEEQDTHNSASSECNGLGNPQREGYKFIGWYTDKNYTKLYNPEELVTGELTLYSKWEEDGNSRAPSFDNSDDSDDSDDPDDHQNTELKIPEENYGEISAPNISGSIEYNGVKMNTITVSYGNERITILDRNLGATKAGTGEDSYGYYFQWGNNHGFTEKDNITHTYNDHTYKGYGPVNPLNSDLFGGTYFDIWDNSKHFDFLWGGEKDNKSNNYNAGNVKLVENLTSRQGPCPEGFHIPSAGEWAKLLELWGYNNSIYNWESDEYNLISFGNNGGNIKKLSNDLLLPFAGEISVGSWGKVSISDVGKQALLWTSSPFGLEDKEDTRKNLSRSIYISDDGINVSIADRSDARNIRCFKDTTLKTISDYSISFDTNGGEHINRILVTPYSNRFPTAFVMSGGKSNRYLTDLYDVEKYLIPVKTGYEFIGWYADKGLTNKFDFDTILTKNIAIYAKRSKEITHDSINGINTITVYDSSSDKSITIMANNLGASSDKKIGYLYQWGNNYGFTEKQLETRTTTPIKYENYGPEKPYSSSKYVPYLTNNYFDYWENNAHYPNLRGGAGDTQNNNWNASSEKSLRKGPCPEGFHIPSKGEWDDLVNIWSKNNGITWKMTMYGYPDRPAYNKIVKDLNLWSGDYYRTLWTSSSTEAGKSYYLGIVNDYTISAGYAMANTSVAQIRCFLNYSIKNDNEENLGDNLENSNDKDNENKSVKYTVKHLTETLTGAYTLLSTETPTAESGSKVTPPVKKFKGYKSPNTKTITVKGDGSSVVEYRYSRELFQITLNKGEGIQTVAGGGSYRFGTKVSLSATPIPGYEFVGFEGDQTTGSFTMPSDNITITAKAKKGNTKYSISYNLNKGKLEQGKTNPTSYSSSSPSFTINPPVRNEYVFAGWEETVNGKVTGIKTYVSIPQGSTGHRKYSAKWKKEGEVEEMIYNQQEDLEGNYVTVEVIASDGDGDSDSGNGNTNGPREYEGFHLVEDFSKQNNIDQGAIGEVLELGSNGPATIIYRYARNSYTLTIEKDAGIELVQGAGTYKYQEPVSIKVKVKDGYQFAGFEGEYNVANFEMPAKNLTIKATTTKRK